MRIPQKKEMCYNFPKKGYVLLITVLIISAVGIASTISIILLGVGASKTSLSIGEMVRAKGAADACLEAALEKIRDDNNFTGTGNQTLTLGSCSYSVPGGGLPKNVTAVGTSGTSVRRVEVSVLAVNPQVTTNSWQEVDN